MLEQAGGDRRSEATFGRATEPDGFHLGGAVLVVSPHFDDAALSAFGALQAAPRAEVLTVFTGAPERPVWTDWDRSCGFADSTEAMAKRADEDVRAFRDSHHRLHHLGLLEVQYRDRADGPRTRERIQNWVADWIAAHPGPVTVLIPAGSGLPRGSAPAGPEAESPTQGQWVRRILSRSSRVVARARMKAHDFRGSPRVRQALDRSAEAQPKQPALSADAFAHTDHLLVRDSVLAEIADLPGVTVILYEEIPYLWGSPADEAVAEVAKRFTRPMRPQRVVVDRRAKAARARRYRSQLHLMRSPLGKLTSAAGYPDRERYWVSEPGVAQRTWGQQDVKDRIAAAG